MSCSGMLLAIHVLREVCIQSLACPQSVGTPKVDLVFGADGLHRHGVIGSGDIGSVWYTKSLAPPEGC